MAGGLLAAREEHLRVASDARADGSVSASTGIDKLRGRGNSTWEKAVHKKPYQIKLSEKQNLLETGVEEEAKKKWVLLSNEAILTTDGDLSMLRNQIALDLSREFGHGGNLQMRTGGFVLR